MKFLEEVYIKNKILDNCFSQIDDEQFHQKNKIELLQELGEMVNETRCFKYWRHKPIDYKLLYEEYADCLIMTLYFFHYHNLELTNDKYQVKENIIDEIAYLYHLCSDYYYRDSIALIKKILYNFIYLGDQLGLDRQKIVEETLNKIKIDLERLNQNE